MSDILEKLREHAPQMGHYGLSGAGVLLEQAADEIARARGLLLLALYHHQGGSSIVGQSIRRFLGIGQHDHLTPGQIAQAKDAEAR